MYAKPRTAALTVLAVGMLALGMLALPAQAASPGWIYLYDTGDSADANYVFHVYSPGSVGLDADYLNMTVKSTPVVSGVGTEANWYVLVYLYDGTTNKTVANKTLAVLNDATVYSNVSLSKPGLYFVANSSALLTIKLQNGTDYSFPDLYVQTFGIYSTEVNQAIYGMIPVIITVMAIAALLPMLSKVNRKR